MTCKPCRVTYQGTRYQIERNGAVGLLPQGIYAAMSENTPVEGELAKAVRAEAARQRRNRNARERSDALRSLGLIKTPYGWE